MKNVIATLAFVLALGTASFAQPDLIITNVNVPSAITKGTMFTLTASVSNEGTTSSGPSTLWYGGTYGWTQASPSGEYNFAVIPALRPGESVTIIGTYFVPLVHPNPHWDQLPAINFGWFADVEYEVPELEDTNNYYDVEIPIN